MLSRLFVVLQYLLPRHRLTALVYRLARLRSPAVKNTLIRGFVRLFGVDADEAREQVPDGFTTFNDFFVRELKPGARVVDPSTDAVVAPVDGTVSQAGTLHGNRLLQAKGFDYSLDDLLAADLDNAARYVNGAFVTVYLAPNNYHRVHAPFAGELLAAHYVPGDLFSVNDMTASRVPGLFWRNERLNLHFETLVGPMFVSLVGALNVGSISTPWSGEIRPRSSGVVETLDLTAQPRSVGKGDLLGWFNLGSTVIVLLPNGACTWLPTLVAGAATKMGEAIGKLELPTS